MLTKHKTKTTILTALLAAMIGLTPALAGTTYNWTGEDPVDGKWTTIDNWLSLCCYPGQTADDDVVIINDPSPRPVVTQDQASLTIESLFVGHQHEIVMDNPITVSGIAASDNFVRFEGTVVISGANGITAEGIWVNSKTMNTVITTTGSATIVSN